MIGAAVRAVAGVFGVAPPGRVATALHWRVGAWCGLVLVLLLPVLVAARGLAAPPRADELARLERALAPATARGVDSVLAQRFYRASAGAADVMPATAAARQQLVTRARVGQLAALAGVALLAYLVTALARGRLPAVLACAAIALLPPVAVDGHVLRAETPAALFAAFAVLSMQCLAAARRGSTVRSARAHGRATWGFALCAVLATALSVATLPTSAGVLLVPGVVLTVGAVQLLLRTLRIARRRGVPRVPLRAGNARLLPWTAMALGGMTVTLWLLLRPEGGPPVAVDATYGDTGLLPAGGVAAAATLAVLVLGGLSLAVRAGARLRRTGRIGADLVLLAYCAIGFGGALASEPGADRLPLAVPAAVLLAEGAFALLLVLQWRIGPRARATA